MSEVEQLYTVSFTTDHGLKMSISGVSSDGVNAVIDAKKKGIVFVSTDRRGNTSVVDMTKVAIIECDPRPSYGY